MNLQMIQVQFGSSIQHMSGLQSGIGICLVIHRLLVLSVQFPLKTTLFLLILKPLDVNFVQKMPEMSDLCYLRKTQTFAKNFKQLRLSLKLQIMKWPLKNLLINPCLVNTVRFLKTSNCWLWVQFSMEAI